MLATPASTFEPPVRAFKAREIVLNVPPVLDQYLSEGGSAEPYAGSLYIGPPKNDSFIAKSKAGSRN